MEVVLNLLVIGFVALIAYWWANQGLFSAVLHCVCVIAAGTLAFATWEPVAGIFLGIKSMTPYAYGIGLMLPFGVYLLVLRVLADKLAPDNLNFPHWANLGVGGAVGLVAAVLTVGLSIIGIGHTHAAREVLGVGGASRANNTRGQPDLSRASLWVPVHKIADGFFATLSTGAMAPTLSKPSLASEHPLLAEQALGLFRDTYTKNGRLARTVAAPGSIRLDKALLVSNFTVPGTTVSGPAYVVDLHFEPGATTEGQGFAISASQLRLVGSKVRGTSGAGSGIAYPLAWSQPSAGGGRGVFQFDDVTHYVSAPAGTTQLDATFVFPADRFGQGEPPKFLHAMGLRLPFPAITAESNMQDGIAALLGGGTAAAGTVPTGLAQINPDDLRLNDSIQPANADLNNLGAMEVKDTNYLFEGSGEYEQGGFRGNKGVVVKGIWAPPNTRVVRLNISRGGSSSIDLWNDRSKVRETAGEDAVLALVDDLGRSYYPIGYIHAIAGGNRMAVVKLGRDGAFYKISAFPFLASSGADQLYAIFTPAVDRKIVAVKLGNEWIAAANLAVPALK
jgi:hypothetical protein